jgi:hypothetical protein
VAPLLVALLRSMTLGQANFILAALAVPAEQAEKPPERARTDRLFDPSAIHGICRRRSPAAAAATAGEVMGRNHRQSAI